MGVDIQNRNWPAINLLRSYPIAEWADRLDTTGSFKLPDDLLVELYFPVGAGVAVSPTRFFLRRLAVYAAGLSLSLGYDDGAGGVTVATAVVGRAGLEPFTPVPLNGLGAFAGSIGKLVIGRLDGTDAQGAGQYAFAPASTQLDVDCIRPQLSGVSALFVQDNNGVGPALTGDVRLALGANIRLSSPDPGEIRIDAIQGAGLNEDCSCAGLPAAAVPISSINGLSPASGVLAFVGDACIGVEASPGQLAFSDGCSQACCGCTEKEQLQASLDYVLEQVRSLRDFQNRLQAEVGRMNSVVIASRVNDTGCVDCGG